MSITLSPDSNAVTVAHEIARRIPQALPDAARTIYTALVAAAVESIRVNGWSTATTSVVLHVPLEQVAKACGLSRQTVWRHIPALQELGVLDAKTHKGAFFGSTRNTGTVWLVRLTPLRGSRAKLTRQDLQYRWRDLEADYRRYRTSYRALQHTENPSNEGIDLNRILRWSLPPSTQKAPVDSVCSKPRRVDLESILDVTTAPRDGRNKVVDLAAQALAQALGDHHSVSWYQRLLWQLLRRFDSTGEDHSYQVYLAAQRALTDRSEGFARKAGALLQSRLKAADWFGSMMNGPNIRVGTKPIKA